MNNPEIWLRSQHQARIVWFEQHYNMIRALVLSRELAQAQEALGELSRRRENIERALRLDDAGVVVPVRPDAL